MDDNWYEWEAPSGSTERSGSTVMTAPDAVTPGRHGGTMRQDPSALTALTRAYSESSQSSIWGAPTLFRSCSATLHALDAADADTFYSYDGVPAMQSGPSSSTDGVAGGTLPRGRVVLLAEAQIAQQLAAKHGSGSEQQEDQELKQEVGTSCLHQQQQQQQQVSQLSSPAVSQETETGAALAAAAPGLLQAVAATEGAPSAIEGDMAQICSQLCSTDDDEAGEASTTVSSGGMSSNSSGADLHAKASAAVVVMAGTAAALPPDSQLKELCAMVAERDARVLELVQQLELVTSQRDRLLAERVALEMRSAPQLQQQQQQQGSPSTLKLMRPATPTWGDAAEPQLAADRSPCSASSFSLSVPQSSPSEYAGSGARHTGSTTPTSVPPAAAAASGGAKERRGQQQEAWRDEGEEEAGTWQHQLDLALQVLGEQREEVERLQGELRSVRWQLCRSEEAQAELCRQLALARNGACMLGIATVALGLPGSCVTDGDAAVGLLCAMLAGAVSDHPGSVPRLPRHHMSVPATAAPQTFAHSPNPTTLSRSTGSHNHQGQ